MNQKRTSGTKSESAKTGKDERASEIESLKQDMPKVVDYWTMVARELEQLKATDQGQDLP